ncbi:AraC family transcriptional regulator [Paenibacillus sp. sptzw28]|uniref:AraC family transcriptional regulator n=1 Tax=Paenibacillus sp. sptzw28 TaxID=715179 RepID=UPI001C6E8966|nr:AraC family transcriptional regulator [Paenibacillus sp. sptzw28]QYR23085.1 AraC family transcriptional regulator [Paenibacillus sp. sptzw28]
MRVYHYLPRPRVNGYACYPDSFGHYYDEPNHRENRSADQCPVWNLHLITKGKGYVIQGDRKTALGAGTGFLYYPHMPQRYEADPEDPWEFRWVHFEGAGISSLFNNADRDEVWLFSWKGTKRLPELLDELLAYGNDFVHEYERRISVLLYEIIVELIHESESLHAGRTSLLRQKMLQTADWIHANCRGTITLKDMAEISGYSEYYVSREFHRVMGVSPVEYLLECRIVQAKHLLASTDWTMKRISEWLGFSQSSYFIRKFRESQGITPDQFRKLGRDEYTIQK